MALPELGLVEYVAAAEAAMLLLLTLPFLDHLRESILSFIKQIIGLFLWVVIIICFFSLQDTNKKYMGKPSCMLHFNDCTQTEDLRYRLLVEKGQKKQILIAWTIFSSWLLYKVTDLVGQVEELRLQLRRRT